MADTIELEIGDRVRLNALGQSRFKRARSQVGTVHKLPKPQYGGKTIQVLFDGNKEPTRLHQTYIQREETT